MHYTLTSMNRALPKFNFREYTMADVERIAKRERINLKICEYNPNINGYYCIRPTPKRKKRFIVINENLCPVYRTFTGLHELGHHFLDAPVSARQWFYCRPLAKRNYTKNEYQADAFALIAMFPFWKLCEYEAVGVENEDDSALGELLERRKKLWEQHGF